MRPEIAQRDYVIDEEEITGVNVLAGPATIHAIMIYQVKTDSSTTSFS